MLLCITQVVIIILLALGAPHNCTARQKPTPPHHDIYEQIFTTYSYNKKLLPQHSNVVNIGLSVRKLQDVHEIDQAVHLVGVMELQWTDSRLVWNATETTENIFVLPSQDLWIPDVYVVNSQEGGYDFISMDGFAEIYNTGNVFFNPTGGLPISCDLDMDMFPFDEQVCRVSLTSWVYKQPHIIFQNNSFILQRGANSNVQWKFIDTSISCLCATWQNNSYSIINFNFHIGRKPLYYVVTLIVPSLFLSAISLVNFALPVSHDQRIAVLVAVILSFTVFQIQLSTVVPRTSENMPLLSHYMSIQMGFVAIGVFLDVIVQQLFIESTKKAEAGREMEREKERDTIWQDVLSRHGTSPAGKAPKAAEDSDSEGPGSGDKAFLARQESFESVLLTEMNAEDQNQNVSAASADRHTHNGVVHPHPTVVSWHQGNSVHMSGPSVKHMSSSSTARSKPFEYIQSKLRVTMSRTEIIAQRVSKVFFWGYAFMVIAATLLFMLLILIGQGTKSLDHGGCSRNCEIVKDYTEVY